VERHEPMFNVPGAVLAVLAILAGVHVVLAALPRDWDTWLTLALAFIPARYAGYAEAIPGGDVATVTSFLSYAFVHGSIFHLVINSAWLLAFGGAVSNRLGGTRFCVLSAVCAIAGAVTFLFFNYGLMAPMIGASGAVSGLMGGTMRFLFSTLDAGGFSGLREGPGEGPIMTIPQALADQRVWFVTGAFLLANLLGVLGLGGVSAGGLAWEAHLGGYFAGFLFIGFLEANPIIRSSDHGMMN
jgi:membrane associated rhomboid family serine protease